MILLYTKESDDFINKVINWLEVDFIRIGERDPVEILNFILNENRLEINIKTPFIQNELSDQVLGLWINGGNLKSGNNLIENKYTNFIFESYLKSLNVKNKIGRLISKFEINKLDVQIQAKALGIKTPKTLITSSKKELEEFIIINGNGVICKRLTDETYYETEDHIYDMIFSFPIEEGMLHKIPDQFMLSLFQEKLNIHFEIRSVFLNGKFYSASIHSSKRYTDYRLELNKNPENIRIIPYSLPKDIVNKLEKLMALLNLNYASIDLIYSGTAYYLLEINPTGQINFINETCNFYLEKEFAEFLNSRE